MTPGAIVTDIEGTTSSIAFVHEVLFPYARARLAGYVAAHRDEVAPILAQVRDEAGDATLDEAQCVALLLDWHDADRKIAPLKDTAGPYLGGGLCAGRTDRPCLCGRGRGALSAGTSRALRSISIRRARWRRSGSSSGTPLMAI